MLPETSPDGEFRGFPWYAAKPPAGLAHPCPTCERLMKRYDRKLSSAMARNLIRVYWLHKKSPGRAYFHVKEFDKEGARGEFGVLAMWGLVEEAPRDQTGAKKSVGYWRLTPDGVAFVRGETTVPQYVMTKWASTLLGFCGPSVGIRECLEATNKFRYDELMGEDYGRQVQMTLDAMFAPKHAM